MTQKRAQRDKVECPRCGHRKSLVKPTALAQREPYTYHRKRECKACGARFRTVEIVVGVHKPTDVAKAS